MGGVVTSLTENWYLEDGEWRLCRRFGAASWLINMPSTSLSSVQVCLQFGSAGYSHIQHHESQVCVVSGVCLDQSLLPRKRRHCIAGLYILYKVHSSREYCLYGQQPPTCQWVSHAHATAAAHPYEFEDPIRWNYNLRMTIYKMLSACTGS